MEEKYSRRGKYSDFLRQENVYNASGQWESHTFTLEGENINNSNNNNSDNEMLWGTIRLSAITECSDSDWQGLVKNIKHLASRFWEDIKDLS